MKATLWRYKIPFTKPLILKGKEHTHREGLIVEMQDFGEIAPLPGFSIENLEEAEEEAKRALLSRNPTSMASVSFGISSALAKKTSLPSLPISGLIWGEDILSQAESLVKQGIKHCKVKVALFPIQEAVDLLHALKKKFPTLRLRVDSNQKWTLDEALFFADRFKKDDFEYLEEPLSSFEELQQFSKKTFFPIAADESFLTEPLDKILSLPSLKAGVIKPSIIPAYLDLIAKLQKKGMRVILSSSIESGVGIYGLAKLAFSLGLHEPLGIDTYRLLHEDVLNPPLLFSKGTLADAKVLLNKEKLCPIFSVP